MVKKGDCHMDGAQDRKDDLIKNSANRRDEFIDLIDISRRLGRGLAQIFGLAMLGLVLAAAVFFFTSTRSSVSTSTEVVFSFPSLSKGEYPDHSKFQADDLRAPNVIDEALKHQGVSDATEMVTKIRNALSIEGIIPATIAAERAHMQAAGQIPPPYVPSEYALSLTLPRNFPLSIRQRQSLLNEIIQVYRDNFWRNYGDLPQSLGNVFSTLKNADYPDYELILNQSIQSIIAFLNQRIGDVAEAGSTFRSPSTGLSFNDLLSQVQIFSQVRLNGTLGLIYLNGLSRDRADAIAKLDYQLRLLQDQESKAVQEQAVVQDLLAKAQERSQNYVLGVKSQATQVSPQTPLLDQGLIESLLANDAYTFLVHQALTAGLKVKDIEADQAALTERRKRMEALPDNLPNEAALIAHVQKSLTELEPSYESLVSDIRKTNTDFARQEFADAIRISAPIATEKMTKPLVTVCAIGLLLGLAAGTGLSLLGIYIGSTKQN